MSFASIWDEDSNGEPANDTDTDSIDSADIDDLPLGADHEQQQIDINQEHRKLLNQARTRKARETARYNKLKRKLESRFQLKEETSQTEAKDIQLKFLTPLFTDAATHSKTSAFSAPDKQKIVRQRGRAVASVLYQLPNVLQAVLTPDPNDPQRSDVRCILDCVVVDDTYQDSRGRFCSSGAHRDEYNPNRPPAIQWFKRQFETSHTFCGPTIPKNTWCLHGLHFRTFVVKPRDWEAIEIPFWQVVGECDINSNIGW